MEKDKKKVKKRTKKSVSDNKNVDNVIENRNIYENFVILGGIIVLVLILLLTLCDRKWTIDGNVVSRGKEKYKIGDYYDYDESNNGNISGLTDVKWKVFKVEDGNLVIMSSSNITNISLGSKDNLVTS